MQRFVLTRTRSVRPFFSAITGATTKEQQRADVAIFKDPFLLSKLSEVWIIFRPDRKPPFWAKIYFQNGQTKGVQEIEAETFEMLCQQATTFANSLKK